MCVAVRFRTSRRRSAVASLTMLCGVDHAMLEHTLARPRAHKAVGTRCRRQRATILAGIYTTATALTLAVLSRTLMAAPRPEVMSRFTDCLSAPLLPSIAVSDGVLRIDHGSIGRYAAECAVSRAAVSRCGTCLCPISFVFCLPFRAFPSCIYRQAAAGDDLT